VREVSDLDGEMSLIRGRNHDVCGSGKRVCCRTKPCVSTSFKVEPAEESPMRRKKSKLAAFDQTVVKSIVFPGAPEGDLRPSFDAYFTLHHKRVPTFYDGQSYTAIDLDQNKWRLALGGLWQASAALLFGCTHTGAGWHLSTPSVIELLR
jgi:hypothetical protein